MKLSDLVKTTAGITGIPEGTVRETARALQRAGRIQTGQRGRYGGSEMTAADAAALAVGLIVSGGEVTKSDVLLNQVSDMRPVQMSTLDQWFDLDQVDRFTAIKDLTFLQLVEKLISDPDAFWQNAVEPDGEINAFHVAFRTPGAFGNLQFQDRGRNFDFFFAASKDAVVESPRYVVIRILGIEFFYEMHQALFGGETA